MKIDKVKLQFKHPWIEFDLFKNIIFDSYSFTLYETTIGKAFYIGKIEDNIIYLGGNSNIIDTLIVQQNKYNLILSTVMIKYGQKEVLQKFNINFIAFKDPFILIDESLKKYLLEKDFSVYSYYLPCF